MIIKTMDADYWKSFWDHYITKAKKDAFSQVGRTLNSVPMTEEMFQMISSHFIGMLELNEDDIVLDFCCGNGLFSAEMAKSCKQVIGVDFSEKLISDLEERNSRNIFGIVANALEIKFKPNSFDRILFAAALQQFTEVQTIYLFQNLYKWLKPGGTLLVTDITDKRRMWNFYNTPERRETYFNDTLAENSILGTWFDIIWLENLAQYTGFNKVKSLDQPDNYWYSHYRFDLLVMK